MAKDYRFRAICKAFEEKRLSRKLKKVLLGKRLSKKQLREMVMKFEVIHRQKHIYEPTETNMPEFCPWCGCSETRNSGNMVEYPELWERIYCLRCGKLVCEADNSTYQHILEHICSHEDGDRLEKLRYLWLHGDTD